MDAQFVGFITNGDGIGNFVPYPAASVAIQEGVLSSVLVDFWVDQYNHFDADGSSASFDFSDAHRGGIIMASGAISQRLVAPVPEPSNWALRAGDLLVVALWRTAGNRFRCAAG